MDSEGMLKGEKIKLRKMNITISNFARNLTKSTVSSRFDRALSSLFAVTISVIR
jgi:hypothetical protein